MVSELLLYFCLLINSKKIGNKIITGFVTIDGFKSAVRSVLF